MHNKQIISFKNFIYIIPDLLILVSFIIMVFYRHVIYDWSYIALYSIGFTLYILINISIYFKLYQWRKLEQSVLSFIFFFLNIVKLLMYILAISVFFNNNIVNPIYLDDLSITAQYGYLVLILISVFFIFMYLLSFIFKTNIKRFFIIISYPYLYEEIRKILSSWEESYFENFCLKLIVLLSESKTFRYLYSLLDLLSFLFRIFMVILFISFCFFKGNFLYLLYVTPAAFLFWILSLFTYYINWIIEGNCNVIREWLQISPVNSDLTPLYKTSFSFKITPEGFNQGFTEEDLPFLVDKWLTLGNLAAFFKYRRLLQYVSGIILMFYFICWCFITYYFFILSPGFGS